MTQSGPDRDARLEQIKIAVQTLIRLMMDRVMNRVLIEDPFIVEAHRAKRPLYAALVPDEIFKGSHFERRFVTPFGTVWEQLAEIAAQTGLGRGVRNYTIHGTVKAERLRRITQVLNTLEHPPASGERVNPDWARELKYVLAGKGEDLPVSVVCDVYAEDLVNHKRYSFEVKAPLPNSDITKVSKEKIFKLYCMKPMQVDEAYFALPYNPYGRRQAYAWSFPARWFNMKQDPVVLIGNEFWEKIGGLGTYQAFLEAINEIGQVYKDRIYREFLGIEPPHGAEEGDMELE